MKIKIQEKDFWQKKKEALEIQKLFNQTRKEIEGTEKLKKEIKDLKEFIELLAKEPKIERELEAELVEEIKKINLQLKRKFQETCFLGKYDKYSAILIIEAGAGGQDAEDWATLLLRMYQRWAEMNNFSSKILFQKFGEPGGPEAEGRIGLKEVSIEIKGKFAYGFLKKESGIHRLVRISPFSAKKLRHTSFGRVEVLPKIEEGKEEIKIKPEDLKIETFRASGPGGQYVNKRESAVRIIHLPTGLRAESQGERLQGTNRKVALEILQTKLAQLKEKEKEKEMKKIKGERKAADFGNQIRSYIFHPYRLIKDHQTGIESSNPEEILAGKLDQFLEAEIRQTGK